MDLKTFFGHEKHILKRTMQFIGCSRRGDAEKLKSFGAILWFQRSSRPSQVLTFSQWGHLVRGCRTLLGMGVGGPWSRFLRLGTLGVRGPASASQALVVVHCLHHPQHHCGDRLQAPLRGHPPLQAGGRADGALLVVAVPSHGVQQLLHGLPAHGAVVSGPGPLPDAPEAELVHAVGHVGRPLHGSQADGALGVVCCLRQSCLGGLAQAAITCSRAALPCVFFGSGCHVLPRDMCKVLEVFWQEGLARDVEPLPLTSVAAPAVTQAKEQRLPCRGVVEMPRSSKKESLPAAQGEVSPPSPPLLLRVHLLGAHTA